MAGLKMTAKEAQGRFFDRRTVIAAIGRGAALAMGRQGAYVRAIARNSMKVRQGASPPGQPPYAHERKIKDLLYYAFDKRSLTTVVGPVQLGKSRALETLEKGGKFAISGIINRQGEFIPLYGMTPEGRRAAQNSGKLVRRSFDIAARPYMKPALIKAKPKLKSFWKGAVRK